ncbi:CDP-alcohol phosphatidyltransferase family protein [Litorihabitans aurantiacus]|uniref:CDP-diacylglycerol--glycerol-3-phosphate 3-phosphatidyltransferase n=1 Tax=Litorihabitans aurantiacus TaxID=1930061 RepID=A0AA37XDD9_9MICO|nr:CDP-alcohol phosphatidyltransferase family protein [Litorihabitans aurantiacus]GMA31065.1 CDP-diacylglycerol--glycerol-3-phosphate 3-phosphatidyltransferase [Litorihabitans aurantiacus]
MTVPLTENRVWTVPNVISFGRLVVLLPLVVWLLLTGRMWWALAALVLLSASDWIDGFLARRLRQTSTLGQRLDPVADRIAILVVGGAMVVAGIIPWGPVAVILAVDVALAVLATLWFRGSPDLDVSRIGKWRTGALLLALPVLIVAAGTDVAWLGVLGFALMYAGAFGHVLAGIGYARGMARRRTRRPVAAA